MKLQIDKEYLKNILLNNNFINYNSDNDEFLDFSKLNDPDIELHHISIDYADGCFDVMAYSKEEKENWFKTHNSCSINDDLKNNIYWDLTGNSSATYKEYLQIQKTIFGDVLDNWLTEHNLTHYDIVWLSVDLDTCQIFVEFDCNGVDFE